MKKLKMLEETFQELDTYVAKVLSNYQPPVSCKKGCSGCCHMMTTILTGEGLLLAKEVASRSDWRYRLRRLASAARAGLRTKTKGEYLDAKIPCPFLDLNECSFYSQRPAACRYYYVVTPASWCSERSGSKIAFVNFMKCEAHAWKLQEDIWGNATAPLPIMVLHCLPRFMNGSREREKALRWAMRGVPSPPQWMVEYVDLMQSTYDEETEDARQAILDASREVGLI